MIKTDIQLIAGVRKNDDHSVRSLFNKYLPMVKAFYQIYSVYGMDLDDWEQEACLVMLKCAHKYDVCRHCRFSTFYRTGLKNRFVDLIRKQNAQRRVPVNSLVSLEMNEVLYANTLPDPRAVGPERSVLLNELLQSVLRDCSKLERSVLLGVIHYKTFREIATLEKCSVRKILRAFARCQRKFRLLNQAGSD